VVYLDYYLDKCVGVQKIMREILQHFWVEVLLGNTLSCVRTFTVAIKIFTVQLSSVCPLAVNWS